jgi:alcohol dehydrogenase
LATGNEGGRRLHQYFHDGSLAERMRVPTECVSRIGAIDAAEAPAWCALGTLLVPYGGLLAAGLEAGQTVLVNGATGAFGSAAVAVALAMGARAVLATGRNGAVLDDLARRFGERVRPVPMQGDEQHDRERILAATPAPIDCMLDFLPGPASAVQVRTAIMAVRSDGTIALMGGVGGNLDLPYPWLMHNCITIRGQYMYPREAAGKMIGLIRAGLVKLNQFALTTFELDQVNEAVTHAAENAGPFKLTIVCPRAA